MRFPELLDCIERTRSRVTWSTVPDGVLRGETDDGRAWTPITWTCFVRTGIRFETGEEALARIPIKLHRMTASRIGAAVADSDPAEHYRRQTLLAAAGLYESPLATYRINLTCVLTLYMQGYFAGDVRERARRLVTGQLAGLDQETYVFVDGCGLENPEWGQRVLPFHEVPLNTAVLRPVKEKTVVAPERQARTAHVG